MQLSHMIGHCQVCEEFACLMNYGVLTCFPCRTFFRRNALNSKIIGTCSSNGNCKINIKTRKFCSACRLAKCLAVGMSTDFIQKKYLNNNKRKLDLSKSTLMKISEESVLDRPAGGTYLILDNSDCLLISNVVHAFDAFSPVSKVQSVINNLKKSPTNLLHNEFEVMHLILSCFNGLESFISATPDFKILTVMEQRSLFQRNLIGLLAVSVAYSVQESKLFETPENESGFLVIYGTETIQKIRSLIRKFHNDPTLMKLIMIALTFSSNCYMVDSCNNMDQDSLLLGTFRLFGSQNFYITIIWKYLVHKYDFVYAVRIFSKLIKHILDLFSISMYLYGTNKIQQLVIDDVVKKTRSLSTFDRQTAIPLWGKSLYEKKMF